VTTYITYFAVAAASRGSFMRSIDCRWDPNLDLNGLGPLVVNPANPSQHTRARHRRLMDMLLAVGDLATIRDVLAAYPYLYAEYGERVAQAKRL
jgi:hypothetical protein